MELKVNSIAIPEAITFNYEELKTEVLQKLSIYETMVYTEDQIKLAKEDRANLNRLKKALNDERIRREKEYMQPFSTFKAQIAEIISIIDKPVAVIDKQIKAAEEQAKAEKLNAIREYFNGHPSIEDVEILRLEQIMDAKWLNASVSMKSIQEAIDSRMGQIMSDLAVVRQLPYFAFEAEQVYLHTLDLAKAVSEAHRLQEVAEKKAAYEAEQAKRNIRPANSEDVAKSFIEDVEKVKDLLDEPCRQWIGFQAFLSVDEAKALGAWLKAQGIKYKAI